MNEVTRRKFLLRSIGSLGATIPIIYYGCDTGGTSGGPLGPSGAGVFTASAASVVVIPPSVTLLKGATQTFIATGGTGGSYTWSISDTALGSIGVSTGVFTAGATAGALVVKATDTVGAIGTTGAGGAGGSGAITIIAPTITVTPAVVAIPNTVTLTFTQTFTASGGTGPYTYNISGLSADYVTAAGASLDLSSGMLSITALPAANETATITATDTFGDTGTATVTIEA